MTSKRVSGILAAILALFLATLPLAVAFAVDMGSTSLTSISVDTPSANIGDTVTISYELTDPDGIASAYPSLYVVGSESDSTTTVAQSSSGGSTNSHQVQVTSQMQAGTWGVAFLDARDKAGNLTRFVDSSYATASGCDTTGCEVVNLSSAQFTVTHTADPNPTTLNSVSVDKTTAKVGDTVTLSYVVTDADGISSVSPAFVVGSFSDGQGSMSMSSSATTSNSFPILITSDMQEGEWHLTELTVGDGAGYYVTFVDSAYAQATGLTVDDDKLKDLSAASFTIEHAEDANPTSFNSIRVNKSKVAVGESVTVTPQLEDADGIAFASPTFYIGDGSSGLRSMAVSHRGPSPTSFSLTVDESESTGTWHVAELYVMDEVGFVTRFVDSTYAKKDPNFAQGAEVVDLSAASFTVVPKYVVLEGDNQSFDIAAASNLTIRFSGPYSLFASLSVDGKTISPAKYTKAEGSTVVTLLSSFLKSLSAGTHTVTANYNDGGSATATLRAQSNDDAKSGDDEPSITSPSTTLSTSTSVTVTRSDDSAKDYPKPDVSNSRHGWFTKTSETITYTVKQKVPDWASSLRTWVDLDPVLEFTTDETGVTVLDDNDATVPATVTIDGQKLTITVPDATALRGKTIVITYQAKLRSGADLDPYLNANGDTASVPYQAHTVFDNEEANAVHSDKESVNFKVGSSNSSSSSGSSSSSSTTTPRTTSTSSTTTKSSTTTTTAKSNTLAKTGDPASVVGVAALAASGVAAMALGVRKKR